MIGEMLGHYRILEKLGEGGMGVVYKALDTHLDRPVALKEASALNHPNIITIYDIASDRGIDFMAMEFVDGKTLDHVIPRGGMRLAETLRLSTQIAGALAKAHTAGITHRDLARILWPFRERISSCRAAGQRVAGGVSLATQIRRDAGATHRARIVLYVLKNIAARQTGSGAESSAA